MVSFTYPLDFPTAGISAIMHRPQSAVAVGRSPYSGKGDVQVYSGQMRLWTVDITPPNVAADIAELEAFFLKLNGPEGTFLLGDPKRPSPRGAYSSGSDTPLVKSDGGGSPNQAGDRVLVTDGWRNNGTGLLLEGDLIQLGSAGTASLHTVLTDVDSDGSGEAEIDIWPRLRRTPSDNDALVLSSPKGLWKLGGDPSWLADITDFYDGFQIDIQEWW